MLLLLSTLVLMVAISSFGCFSELRNVRCENDSHCFVHEGESCFDGRCVIIRQEDAGHDDAGDESLLISGQVTDAATGDPLMGATICDDAPRGESTQILSNDGFYSLQIRGDTMRASHPDYRTDVAIVTPSSTLIDFDLQPCDQAVCDDSPEPCP